MQIVQNYKHKSDAHKNAIVKPLACAVIIVTSNIRPLNP